MIPVLQAKLATPDKPAQQAKQAQPAKPATPVKLVRQVQPVKPVSKAPQDLLANPVQMVLRDPRALRDKRVRQEVQA